MLTIDNGKVFNGNSKFLYVYDAENNILHLRDKDDYIGMSLINSIDSNFRNQIVSKIEKDEKASIDLESLRCFVYTDGDGDFFENEVDEYIFSHEKIRKNPFVPLKKTDKELKYWYR